MTSLPPGSALALDAGCFCSPEANDYGHAEHFLIRSDCPVHGQQPLRPGDTVVFPDSQTEAGRRRR